MLPSGFVIFVTSLTPVYINALMWTYMESIPSEEQDNTSKYQAAIKFVNTADNKDHCDKETIEFNLGYVTNFAKRDKLCQLTTEYELLCRKMSNFGKNTPWIERTIKTFAGKNRGKKLAACVANLYNQLEIPQWPKPEGETTAAPTTVTELFVDFPITDATTQPVINEVPDSRRKTIEATRDSGDTSETVASKGSRAPYMELPKLLSKPFENATTNYAHSEGTAQPVAIKKSEVGVHTPAKGKQKQKNTTLYVIIMTVLVIMHLVLITLLIFTIRCWRQLRRRENLQSNSRSSHNSTASAPPTSVTPATPTRPVPSAQPSAKSLDLWSTKK